jgi:hypothetical protein
MNESRSALLSSEKCSSSYSKSKLAILFYVLIDEGILFFDSTDAKKTESVFRNLLVSGINFTIKRKNLQQKLKVSKVQRRKRDSNPRTCYSQQFSRLPHSTALPFLQYVAIIC